MATVTAEQTMAAGRRCLITLTTDFGTEDGNVGLMKGVVLGINPDAIMVDLSHDIPPQDITAAAYVLRRAYGYFPPGTVHLVVVDPGVGTDRRPIAMQSSDALFVAPDNGVLSDVLEHLRSAGDAPQVVHLTDSAYWLPEVSNVFHGRDIFAPVAAHLSCGVPLHALGSRIDDPVTIPPPLLTHQPGMISGQVMHVDHFGNLLTNIPGTDLAPRGDQIVTRIGQARVSGLRRTFAQGRQGDLVAYIDSSGHLAIAAVNGSAQQLLHCQVGDRVDVALQLATRACPGEPSD
jgi:S-adenosylmethionine hydrolase